MAAERMIIDFANTFLKQLRKLSKQDRIRIDQTVQVFRGNPFDLSLRNHKLKGNQKGIRSISAAYDIRLLYREENNHAIVLFIEVGRHEKIYN